MEGFPTLRQQNYPGARGKNLVSTELYADWRIKISSPWTWGITCPGGELPGCWLYLVNLKGKGNDSNKKVDSAGSQ